MPGNESTSNVCKNSCKNATRKYYIFIRLGQVWPNRDHAISLLTPPGSAFQRKSQIEHFLVFVPTCNHRASLESAGLQNSCDHLTGLVTISCHLTRTVHGSCMQTSIPVRQLIVTNAFRWSQKMLAPYSVRAL